MSQPRPIIPGRTYLITRRCSERRFFLRPGRHTNQAFLYELAVAARRCGLEVSSVLAMSNHYHAVVHDPDGQLPEFIRCFHQLVAKAMNAHWGRSEALWASEQTSVVECVDAEDAFDKMVYALVNPVAADLVDRAVVWPGVSSLRAQLNGTTMTAQRPPWFHDKNGAMPEEATLELHRLRGFEHLSDEAWRDKLRRAIDAAEAASAKRRERLGKRIKGRKAILADSPFAAPATPKPRRQLNPRVAAKNKRRRIEALKRNQAFVVAYREALRKLREGLDVLFPPGTYKLVRLGLARCAPS